MNEITKVWAELHARLTRAAADGQPVTAALIDRVLGEMEADQAAAHKREMAALRWRGRGLWVLAALTSLLLLIALLQWALAGVSS